MGHVEQSDIDPNVDAVAAPPRPRTPEERLEASRAAMRANLAAYYQRDRAGQPEVSPGTEGDEPEWLRALADAMSDRPLVAIAMRWLRMWWHNHPWRTLLDLSGEVLHEVVAPVARRHPWFLLGGAALVGIALSRMRPWRWISGGALLTGFLPQINLAAMLDTITQALKSFHPREEETQQAEPAPEEAVAPAPVQAANDSAPPASVH